MSELKSANLRLPVYPINAHFYAAYFCCNFTQVYLT
jgi:hypothetical protein